MQLFISYVHANKNTVDELALRLESAGHQVEYDQEITKNEHWWQGILNAIEKCEVFIYLLSPNSVDSVACQTEYQYALALNKAILPIVVRKAELPGERKLDTFPYIEASHLPVPEVMPEVNQKLATLREGVLTGKFRVPKPAPARLPYPFPPNAVQEFKKRNADLRATSQMEVSQMIYELKQLAYSSESDEAKQARDILRQMASSTHLTVNLQENIKQAIPVKAQPYDQMWIAAGVVAAVVLVIVVMVVVL